MYVCMYVFSIPYLVPSMDIGSPITKQSHYLRVSMVSSCYQRSDPILSEADRDISSTIYPVLTYDLLGSWHQVSYTYVSILAYVCMYVYMCI